MGELLTHLESGGTGCLKRSSECAEIRGGIKTGKKSGSSGYRPGRNKPIVIPYASADQPGSMNSRLDDEKGKF
jgi:hypothetical protein